MVTIRPFEPQDAAAAYRLRRTAFGGPREVNTEWAEPTDEWYGFVAELDDAPAGFLRVWNFRQFFGGKAVPCGGVASVTSASWARGRGVVSALLRNSLAEMRDRGQVISALYPAAPGLYRHFGWESAGTLTWLTAPLPALSGFPRGNAPLRPATEADLPAIHATYLRSASQIDGMLDRSVNTVAMIEDDIIDIAPAGFVTAERPDTGPLLVTNLIADDSDTAYALLASVASWSSQIAKVSVKLIDPSIELLLPHTQDWAVEEHPWMLRVVDLPAAVAARGWPAVARSRSFSVDIDVVDEDAPWNAGRHRLVVEDGTVTCAPGGSGEVRLTTGGLGAWFSGSVSAATLRRAGLLSGNATAAASLDALTGAPRPVRIADDF